MTLDGNPNLRRVVRGSADGRYSTLDGNVATMKSMAWKSVALCAVTVVSAVLTAMLLFYLMAEGNISGVLTLSMILLFSAIPLIIISLVITFVPKTASVLGFIYCILEGVTLGVTSALFDLLLPGIALMAFLGTCMVFMISWAVFRLLGNKVSSNFVRFVIISFTSLLLLEGIGLLLSLFVPVFAAILQNIWIQIAISAVMILWAAFIIIIDLNNMQLLETNRVDKKYEWFAAFSLTTTLMWLYVEILELLFKVIMLAKKD